ncbi:membrane protein of ER body-like protein isoform X2 [Actinidia eriantha]|uniref:membrane protein of ER body-like protein isoform X2 n=1 Tax=Actinidia eriantha TaxID=165200 RepID=UPI00258953F1|nr:membrane protein of ER body-like protein isoform X2 [Actinidia eriantha]
MKVAEQQQQWQEEAEEREDGVALQGRRTRHLAAAGSIAVSDNVKLPSSERVNEFEEEEEEEKYHQEAEEREEAVLQGRKPPHPTAAATAAVAVSDDVMLPSSERVNEFEEEEYHQEAEEREEAVLQGRQPPHPTAAAVAVSDDLMLPLSQPVTGFEEEEEYHQEAEEREEEEALQGRRPRHPAAAAVAVGDDVMMPSSKPVNGLEEEDQQKKFQNGNKDGNYIKVDSKERSEKNVYYAKDEGTESIYGSSFTEHKGFQGSASEKNPGDDGLTVTIQNFDSQKGHDPIISHQYKENLKDDSFAGFRLLSSENLSEEHKTNKSFSNITEPRDEIEPIKEIDELDVERVLEKQDTHDLYCPNCNSCITRRVILRKRKRKIRISGEDANRNRSETKVAYKLDAISAHVTNDQDRNVADIPLDSSLTPAANDYNRDREPELFRCLSCFSFFIPTGTGFKLFKILGDKSTKENMQSPQPISATKKSWLSYIFASRKEELLIDQGSGLKVDVEENIDGASKLEVTMLPQSFDAQGLQKNSIIAKPQEGGDPNVPSSTQGPIQLGKVIADSGDKLNDVMKQGTEGLALDHLALDSVHPLDSSNGTVAINGSDHPTTQLAGRTPAHSEEPAEDIVFRPHQDGLKILIHSSAETLTIEKSQMNQKLNVAIERKSADDKDSKFIKPIPELGESDINEKVNIVRDLSSENGKNIGATLPTRSIVEAKNEDIKISGNAYSSGASQHVLIVSKVDTRMEDPLKADKGSLSLSVQDALLLQDRRVDINKDSNDMPTKVSEASGAAQYAIIGTKVDIRMEEPLKADKDAFSLSVQDALLLQERQFSIDKVSMDTPAKVSEGQDTIIIVKDGPAQEAQGIISAQETRPSTQTESAEAGEFRGLEIIKSMVYGGLIESIASLGIVSSAAGADAAPLNILALGVANLIGGLFLMLHNMWELKNDHSSGTSNQVAEGAADRYKELLGRRENFLLHATVAVLSFLIFGLLPPVVYGFSFRESNNRDFKLIAVAVASLLCIIILAIGKAHVQRPPKSYLKTIIYFVITGFMASGISYAAGDMFKKLLDKLGWFNSSVVLTMPVLETIPVQPGWGSY